MTKKSLQGIAAGILVTTIIFAFQINFQTSEEKEIDSQNQELTQENIDLYLSEQQLVMISVEEYEMLLSNIENEKNEDAQEPETIVVREITFTIEPGMSSGEVASLLEKAGVIESRQQFQQYIIEAQLEGLIKSGEYTFTNQMSLEEIIDIIT